MKDLVTLLLYLEYRIRDPATSSSDRESQRQHRRTCVRKYIECCGTTTSDIWEYGLISLRYYEAADALQSYLKSIKHILDEDPTNADNPQMVVSAKPLFDRMPHPRDYTTEMSKYHLMPGVRALPSDFTEQVYTQLHSTITGEMEEIQARITDTDWKTLSLEGTEPLPENGDRKIRSKFSEAPLEWWGN
ncbi:hypothetical protein FRC00_001088 [Tulasnella sp. 408]|nr:hypothetical protein FRC00_001088 [Tulasnella sp. 408]